jgi:hypothetical protein
MQQVSNSKGESVGTFDGEYIYDHQSNAIYRIDGDEVYTAGTNSKYIGTFENGTFYELNGNIAFTLSQ